MLQVYLGVIYTLKHGACLVSSIYSQPQLVPSRRPTHFAVFIKVQISEGLPRVPGTAPFGTRHGTPLEHLKILKGKVKPMGKRWKKWNHALLNAVWLVFEPSLTPLLSESQWNICHPTSGRIGKSVRTCPSPARATKTRSIDGHLWRWKPKAI